MNELSVIIPVYRNTKIFLELLQKNRPYFKKAEVVVANDYPAHHLTHKIHAVIPKAIVINNKKTKGFGENVNSAVNKASGNYILLLNSDVLLQDASYQKALSLLKKNPDVFAVSFAQIEKNNTVVGGNSAYLHHGFVVHHSVPRTRLEHNFWAEGGSMLFSKKIFNFLGGFDALYTPFYWEDIDLSYRAWKSGYRVLFDPNIAVHHQHETTIKKYFSSWRIKRIAYRNQFIFHLKNITDQHLIIQRKKYTIIMFLKALSTAHISLIIGYLSAIVKLPMIYRHRKKQEKLFRLSDSYIMSQFSDEKNNSAS